MNNWIKVAQISVTIINQALHHERNSEGKIT